MSFRWSARRTFRPILEALEQREVPTSGGWAIVADPEGDVFHDVNGNGTLDTSESTVGPGWTVYVDTNENGMLDTGEVNVLTDSNGHYNILLPDGTYSIRVVPQSPFLDDRRPLGTVIRDFAWIESPAQGEISGLAWANGSLYVTFTRTTNNPGDNVMYEADPQTGAALGAAVSLPDEIFDIAFDGTDLWGADLESDQLIRFNFAGQELQRISLPGIQVTNVEWDGAALRVLDDSADRIYQIDPSGTGSILGYVNAPPVNCIGLAFDGTHLWVSETETDLVYALDPATGAVQKSFTHYGDFGYGMAIRGTNLWLTDHSAGRVFQYDLGYGGGRIVTVAGAPVAGVDLAVFQIGSATGIVFNDLNADGTQGGGEAGLAGWRIYDDTNGNDQYDAWEVFADTDSAGHFTLGELTPGAHDLRAYVRAGWQMTAGADRSVTILSGQTLNLTSLGARQVGIGLIGPEIQVNTTQAGIQYAASKAWNGDPQRNVAADAVGNLVVVWNGNGTGDSQGIFFQRYDANGNALGGETRANTSTTGTQEHPRLARASANGQYAIAWADRASGSSKVRIFNTNGIAITGELTVIANTSRDSYYVRSIAMDADGDFVILYTSDSSEVYVKRYNKLGQVQGNAFRVETLNWMNAWCDLAIDANGNFAVTYAHYRFQNSSYTVKFQRYDNKGKALGSTMTVYSGTHGAVGVMPQLNMNSAGQFVITYYVTPNGDSYAKAYNANGTLRSTVIRSGRSDSLSVAVEANGDYLLATDDNEIQVHRYTSDGVLKEVPFQINTNTAGAQEHPSVVATSNGGFVVAWSDLASDVRMQRVAPVGALHASGSAGSAVGPALTQQQADTLLTAALAQWRRAGASLSALRGISIQIADLPGNQLGLFSGKTIYLDVNAAGHGWFVDRTPGDSREFHRGRAITAAARGKMDALSVIAHEVGHILGQGHDDHGVMAETLRAGERRLPAPAKATAVLDTLFARWGGARA